MHAAQLHVRCSRLLGLLTLFGLLAAGCSSGEPPRQAVMIMLDAARPDRMSCYGYERDTTPHLDALAAKGVRYDNHYTQGTRTRASIPALFYSRYYAPHLFPGSARVPYTTPYDLFLAMDEESISIPRAMSENGMLTAIVSAHTWIRSTSEFAQEFDEVYDLPFLFELEGPCPFPRADEVIEFASRWIRQHADEDFFLYIHVMDTHFPHYLEEDAQRFFADTGFTPADVEGRFNSEGMPHDYQDVTAADQAYVDALYDGSFASTDRALGDLFALFENELEVHPLVTITSDHGEFLFDRPGRLTHGDPWYEPVARLPWILTYPGHLEPGSVSSLTENVDVAPTMFELLGLDLEPRVRFDGQSQIAVSSGERPGDPAAFSRLSVRNDRHKAIFHAIDGVLFLDEAPPTDSFEGELYDLLQDPNETKNLWREDPAKAAELLELYRTELGPSYYRFVGTKGRRIPTSPFALSVRYFESPEPIERLPGQAAVQRWVDGEETGWRWVHSRNKEQTYYIAHETEHEIALDVEVPNGTYRISAAFTGSAEFRLGNQATRPTQGMEMSGRNPFHLPPDLSQDELWEVEVTEERLYVWMAPRGPFAVSHFGFTPIIDGAAAVPDVDQDVIDERLRALGYVDTD